MAMADQVARRVSTILTLGILVRVLRHAFRLARRHRLCARLAMEAFAVINILKFAEFAGKVVLRIIDYHSNSPSILNDDLRLSSAVRDLNVLLDAVSKSGRQGVDDQDLDSAWHSSLERCVAMGREVQEVVMRIQGEKKKSFWKTTARAVRATMSADKLRHLQAGLQAAQQDVLVHLSVEQKEQLQNLAYAQDKMLASMSETLHKSTAGLNQIQEGQRTANEHLKTLYEGQPVVIAGLQHMDARLQQVLTARQTPRQRSVSGLELCLAVREGNAGEVVQLLKAGADPNYSRFNDQNERPLHLAANANSSHVLQALLRFEPLLDPYSRIGVTPLMTAAIAGDHVAIRSLLAAGCNLELGLRLGRPSIIGTIDIDDVPTEGASALFLAAYNGHTLAVEEMLRHNANLENCTNHSFTPLIAASRAGHVSVVRVLLDAGANIEAKTDGGFTSLIYAAHTGQPKTAELLIEKRANLNARKSWGVTALLEACWMGRADLVRILIRAGADLTLCCHGLLGMSEASALHLAIYFGNGEIVQCLVEAQPDLSKWDGSSGQEKPIELARRKRLTEIVSLLEGLSPPSQIERGVVQLDVDG